MINDATSPESYMPRPRPPFLHSEISRHGRRVWYFRKGRGRRVRLPEEYGSAEFWRAYHAAAAGEAAPAKRSAVKGGSLAWLIARYRESSEWSKLSMATRRQRENIFKHIVESAGNEPYSSIRRADVVAGRDRRRETPAAGANFLKTLRGLFKWAVEAGYVESDPTEGVKRPENKSDGHHTWTEAEAEAFERRWPIGTRERLAFALFLYTGLRRGDVARLGRQHVRNGVIHLTTEKTGTPVVLPILPELAEIIAASPCGDLAFVATPLGRPMTKESLGNWFRDACKAAGVPGSAHGLRKLSATRAAEAGATVAELESIFGWEGGNMASLYTRAADRSRLARSAIDKLARPETGTSIPAPSGKVRASRDKA